MNSEININKSYLIKRRSIILDNVFKGVLVVLLFSLASCASSKKINPNILYFQRDLDSMSVVQIKENIIKNNDVLSVQIFSKSLIQDQANIFNLPDKNVTVGLDGTIEMPLLGKVQATGLTKAQLQKSLVDKLSNYIKDPGVLVKFAQFNVNVLGEVKTPGPHSFLTDKVTVIDAISAAGDLTNDGKREDVTIIRETNFERKLYTIDLRSGNMFNSPAFQLEPNDLVYVGANVKKLRQLNTGPDRVNGLQTTSTILSIISTVTFLIYTFFVNK